MLMLVVLLSSCSKESSNTQAVVNIISPQLFELYTIPDTVEVDFEVISKSPINYIRISIDNINLVPLTNQAYIYPNDDESVFNTEIFLSNVDDKALLPPYNMHIAIDVGGDVQHNFREITIKKPDKSYEGFIAFSQGSNNSVQMDVYDLNSEIIKSQLYPGYFIVSDISGENNLAYLATSSPNITSAINIDSGNYVWGNMGQLPYPLVFDLIKGSNTLYQSSEMGRIIGFNLKNGLQVFNTKVLSDTIPHNMAVNENFIFADFTLRNPGNKLWISFYRTTGQKYSQFVHDYDTKALFAQNDTAILFCVQGNQSNVVNFSIIDNNIIKSTSLDNIAIDQVYSFRDNVFTIVDGNKIISYNNTSGNISNVFEANDIIIDVKYEEISSSYVIALPHEIIMLKTNSSTFKRLTTKNTRIESIELIYK